MITYNHIISELRGQIIKYQLPFNQFSPDSQLVFLDENLSVPMTSGSFIFCTKNTFLSCLNIPVPPKVCFFISGVTEPFNQKIPNTWNYIASPLDYSVLCSKVVSIHQKYVRFQNRLFRIPPDRHHMEAYLQDLAAATGSCCYLYNHKRRLLLCASAPGSQQRPAPLSQEECLLESPQPAYNPSSGLFSCLARQALHELNFYLKFVSPDPFPGMDICWIAREALSHLLTGMENNQIDLYTADELAAGQFITRIMNGTLENRTDAYEGYRSLSPAQASFTTVIYILLPDTGGSMAQLFLMSDLKKLFPEAVIGPWHRNIIIFQPNYRKESYLRFHDQELQDLMEKYNAYAGYSLWTKWRFRTSIIIASSNAMFGKLLGLGGKKRLFYHMDYSLYHLIDQAAKSFMELHRCKDLTYLIHPSILHINLYDIEHNTNLLEVFYYYLIHGCSVNETAAVMELHRNTVQSKLNKINELVREDYTKNGLIQCHLLISCMIFFYQDRYLKEPFHQFQSMEHSFRKTKS